MRCVTQLAHRNFEIGQRPGKISQHCDNLDRYSIAETHTNEIDLEKVSIFFVNSCLSAENNWISVSSLSENKLEKRLKGHMETDPIISPVLDDGWRDVINNIPSVYEQYLYTF